MKTYCLCFALLMFALNYLFGNIKNGYAAGIQSASVSIEVFNSLLLSNNKMAAAKRAIEAKVKKTAKCITYYELTEDLLKQFRMISQDLYNEIDTIKDRKARITDIYVKFISEGAARVQAWGITGLTQVAGDRDAYLSEYRGRTVSIKVLIMTKALMVISHELWHVKYVEPDIASCVDYHVTNYRQSATDACHVGPNANDVSGKSAVSKNFLFAPLLFADLACPQRHLVIHIRTENRIKRQDEFLSLYYNHFEGGVFFSDVELGLNVLWKASFKKNNAYKENVGFFVPGGLLILPNRENTYNRGKLSALQIQLKEGYPFVWYKSTFLKVLGIIHTHPNIRGEPRPSPKNDYQYCYLGIHNYIMDHNNLFDAYKDSRGRECYRRLGTRSDYHTIPFVYLVYSDGYLHARNQPNK